MTRSTLGILLAFGALAGLPGPAAAAVRYADPGGDGPASSCPRSNPCEINDATEDASVEDGDEVVVLPGTYDLGNGNIELSDTIDLHGARGGPPPVIFSTSGNGTTLDGGDASVHDLVFKSLEDNPIFGALGVSGAGVVERVVAISDNAFGCQGAPLAPGYMRDTVCVSGGSSVAGLVVRSFGGGAFSYTLQNVTALGFGLGSAGLRAELIDGGAMTVDAQNVIARGAVDVSASRANSGALTVNLTNSNYMSRATLGTSVSITDPATNQNQTEFPSLAEGSFRQLAGSPTIDSGGDFSLLGSLDFDRQPRIQGARVDIGADEFDTGLKLKLKARRKQDGPAVKVKLKCPQEDCSVKVKGKVKGSGESAKLKPARAFIPAGQGARLKLKPKDRSDLEALLATGDAQAKIKARGEDGGGSAARKRKTVNLTG